MVGFVCYACGRPIDGDYHFCRDFGSESGMAQDYGMLIPNIEGLWPPE